MPCSASWSAGCGTAGTGSTEIPSATGCASSRGRPRSTRRTRWRRSCRCSWTAAARPGSRWRKCTSRTSSRPTAAPTPSARCAAAASPSRPSDGRLLDRNIDRLMETGYLPRPSASPPALPCRLAATRTGSRSSSRPPRRWPGADDAPVAFCADLSPASVLGAYRRGIIPLPASDEYFRTLNEFRYEDQVAAGTIAIVGDEAADPYWVAWWSPDPRPVIGAGDVHLGRNVRKRLRRDALTTTADAAFREVAEACRAGREPRWLTDPLLELADRAARAGVGAQLRGVARRTSSSAARWESASAASSAETRCSGGSPARPRSPSPTCRPGWWRQAATAHRRAVGRPAAALPGRRADAARALPAAARPPAGAAVAPGRPAARPTACSRLPWPDPARSRRRTAGMSRAGA